MQRSVWLVFTCSVFAALSALAQEKAVISHRGACGYLPEHTLESYAFAYAAGADYIEQDVALTKDREFICLHDIHLEKTTDVEVKFPDRKRDDGKWYAADFTLDEIRQLRAHERLPKRFPADKSRFEVPTFREAIELIQGLNRTTGRNVGIYPELKNPSWHTKHGLPMEEAFVAILAEYGYTSRDSNIFVQCFEPGTLKKLRLELKLESPQVFLMGDDKSQDALVTDEGLAEIATFAEGIGPDKNRIETDPDLVARAHAHGLVVHPYTMRSDLRPRAYATPEDELKKFLFDHGVDGLFTDFPDTAAEVIRDEGASR